MGICSKKIINKENYMKRSQIGEDLFLKSQVIINMDTEEWAALSFKSNVFYKLLVLGSQIYHPDRFVNIKVVDY
ncbi:hypothetical protein [uncultured Clostridium sp.]|uniref:hypothetical protein n=1 Tax=uncultured Clostridium sp. TaxID=59620 RepID=UPI0025E47E91|nr:hypothetical protein [uncultured Clostridium sp.]